MKNAVIITAKGGNESVENKNIIPILGVPVFLYPLRAAKFSTLNHSTFVSTEDPHIKSLSIKEDVGVIDRPKSLSLPSSMHKDVIEHAVKEVESIQPDIENIIVLLGNTVMVTPALIDKAFEMLESNIADSVLSVWKAQDDHPFRALQIDGSGNVKSFLNVECGSNRQSYPDVYFYDQGIWAFKKECAIKQEGPAPWVWLGKNCKAIERPWVTGRDIHSWIDISASSWYLNSIQTNDYANYKDL